MIRRLIDMQCMSEFAGGMSAYGTSEGVTKAWDERGRGQAKEVLAKHGWKQARQKYFGEANKHGIYKNKSLPKHEIMLGTNGWNHGESGNSFMLGRHLASGHDAESLNTHLDEFHKNK